MKNYFLLLFSLFFFACEEKSNKIEIFTYNTNNLEAINENYIRYYIIASDDMGNILDWKKVTYEEYKDDKQLKLQTSKSIEKFTYTYIIYYPTIGALSLGTIANVEVGTVFNDFTDALTSKSISVVADKNKFYNLRISDFSLSLNQAASYNGEFDFYNEKACAIAFSKANRVDYYTHFRFFPIIITRNQSEVISLDFTGEFLPMQKVNVSNGIIFNNVICKPDPNDRDTWVTLPERVVNSLNSPYEIYYPGNVFSDYGSYTAFLYGSNSLIENYSTNQLFSTEINEWQLSLDFSESSLIKFQSSIGANYAFLSFEEQLEENNTIFEWNIVVPSGFVSFSLPKYSADLLKEIPILKNVNLNENNLIFSYLRKWENFESITKHFFRDDTQPFYSFAVNNQLKWFDTNSLSAKLYKQKFKSVLPVKEINTYRQQSLKRFNILKE